MNERIHELAVQAEKLADEATNAYNDDTGNWQKVWNKIYDEKFAELLIRECIQAIQNESMNSDDEWERGLVYAENGIKEHFGVK
jgi:hypothetical protein